MDEIEVSKCTCSLYELRFFKSYVCVTMAFIFYEVGDVALHKSNSKNMFRDLFKEPA